VGICDQITILILDNITSRLVTFLIFIYASLQISNIFVFIINFKLINFAFSCFYMFYWFHVLNFADYLH
jgi:hypothetical protein